MPKITMVQSTRHEGQPYLAGHTYDVDEAIAAHWTGLGIAEKGAAKAEGETAHERAQREVAEQDLAIAAAHGDVKAARALDTGQSARASLTSTKAQRA